MATVSFAALDQSFDIADNTNVAFSSYLGSGYTYQTTGGDKWQLAGVALTDNGTLPTGGTVTSVDLDLDHDVQVPGEILITGLSVAATSLGIGAGTDDEQNSSFWSAVLAGDDTLNFAMADHSVDLIFAGDGIYGGVAGGDDSFLDGGAALSGLSGLFGDYVFSGGVSGGNDSLTVGCATIAGDFQTADSHASGGDDTIAPARLADVPAPFVLLVGDSALVTGTLTGGDDLIDLRLTDVTALTTTIFAIGDAFNVMSSGFLICGDDTIHGSSRGDIISGDQNVVFGFVVSGGHDLLYGHDGDDQIIGWGGFDSIYGGDGDDFLQGGANDDTLVGGLGDDTLDGGDGYDTADFSDLSTAVFVNLETLTNPNGTAINFTSVENVTGSSGADTLTGSAGTNRLRGGAGDDTLNGGDASDTLWGGDDEDVMNGGKGFDVMLGEAGDDILKGGSVADTLLGQGGDDVLVGGGGVDVLDGGDGVDAMRGNQGTDSLGGGLGDDVLAGRGGADTLKGGDGFDVLAGKGGNDLYQFELGGDTDTIRSYSAGFGGDAIQLIGFGAAFDSFAEVLNAATDNGVDTTIDFGGGDILVIKGVVIADFDSSDFAFI